jgi:N-methylhydantoinase A/oxoprolinase/acetone carboxylase beta subunit
MLNSYYLTPSFVPSLHVFGFLNAIAIILASSVAAGGGSILNGKLQRLAPPPLPVDSYSACKGKGGEEDG